MNRASNLNFIGEESRGSDLKYIVESIDTTPSSKKVPSKIEMESSLLDKKTETEEGIKNNVSEILLPDVEELKNISNTIDDSLGVPLKNFVETINNLFLQEDSVENFSNAYSLSKSFYDETIRVVESVNSLLEFPVEEVSMSEKNITSIVRYKFLQDKLSFFRSGFNHEIRTPFNGILGFVVMLQDYMAEGNLSNEDSQVFKGQILKAINKLSNLFQGLLLLTENTHFEGISKQSFLQHDLFQLEGWATKKGISLKINIPDEEICFSDENRLNMIMRNFLNNAIKFTPEGGKVSINVSREGEKILFSVQDTGVGINEEGLQELNDVFNNEYLKKRKVQYHHKGTNEEPTYGEGLILSKHYADDIFGEITVESIEGEGSTFTLSIPAEKEEVLEKDRLAKRREEEIIASEVRKRKIELLKKRFTQTFNGVMEKK